MQFETLLKAFTSAVEAGDGQRLGRLFAEHGVYHDRFYGAFHGRDAIATMLEEHFWRHGKDFIWEMRNPVCNGEVGFVDYLFSYTSTLEEARGKRIIFEGMSRFDLEDGKIREYREVFDTGTALVQLNFNAERIRRFLIKAVDRLRDAHRGSQHLPE